MIQLQILISYHIIIIKATIYAPTRIIKKKDITIFWMVLQLHEVIHINVQQRLR